MDDRGRSSKNRKRNRNKQKYAGGAGRGVARPSYIASRRLISAASISEKNIQHRGRKSDYGNGDCPAR
jgi:hypothetical protein